MPLRGRQKRLRTQADFRVRDAKSGVKDLAIAVSNVTLGLCNLRLGREQDTTGVREVILKSKVSITERHFESTAGWRQTMAGSRDHVTEA